MPEQPCDAMTPHSSVQAAIAHIGAGFDTPWWGHKNSANLVNVGIVIGRLRSPKVGWRLDYDPVKGLHINYEDTSGAEKISIYHKITPISIGVPNPESVMLEYWLAWTKKYRDNIPLDVLTVFKREYHSCVNNHGGNDAQRLRLTGTKYALFGFGNID